MASEREREAGRLADAEYADRVRKAEHELALAIDAAYQAGLDVEVSVHESWALTARPKGKPTLHCQLSRPL